MFVDSQKSPILHRHHEGRNPLRNGKEGASTTTTTTTTTTTSKPGTTTENSPTSYGAGSTMTELHQLGTSRAGTHTASGSGAESEMQTTLSSVPPEPGMYSSESAFGAGTSVVGGIGVVGGSAAWHASVANPSAAPSRKTTASQEPSTMTRAPATEAGGGSKMSGSRPVSWGRVKVPDRYDNSWMNILKPQYRNIDPDPGAGSSAGRAADRIGRRDAPSARPQEQETTRPDTSSSRGSQGSQGVAKRELNIDYRNPRGPATTPIPSGALPSGPSTVRPTNRGVPVGGSQAGTGRTALAVQYPSPPGPATDRGRDDSGKAKERQAALDSRSARFAGFGGAAPERDLDHAPLPRGLPPSGKNSRADGASSAGQSLFGRMKSGIADRFGSAGHKSRVAQAKETDWHRRMDVLDGRHAKATSQAGPEPEARYADATPSLTGVFDGTSREIRRRAPDPEPRFRPIERHAASQPVDPAVVQHPVPPAPPGFQQMTQQQFDDVEANFRRVKGEMAREQDSAARPTRK